MLKFNIENSYINQDFSIPSPFIRYVILQMGFNSLKKVYKTCKYFYVRFEMNIIDELRIYQKENEIVYSLSLFSNKMNRLPDKLWLTRSLLLCNIPDLSPIISKIARCDLCHAYISTDMTINEFAFFTRSKTIKKIIIASKIYSSHDNNLAPLEDVLSHLLSAYYMRISECFVTKTTMKKLLLLNFRQRLIHFSIWRINQMLDANLMNNFLIKNLEDKAGVQFAFENKVDQQTFIPQMFEKINAWTPEERKPRTFPSAFI